MATNGKTVSLKAIVERVYQDFKFNYALDWNDAIEWAGSLLANLRCPIILSYQTQLIQIKEGRGKLPCDLESIIQTARAEVAQGGETTEQIDLINTNLKNRCQGAMPNGELFCLSPMRWSTDSFHTSMHATNWDYERHETTNTYLVNGNYIYTSFSEGFVMMSYKAIPVDSEGYPLIPDDEKWRNAVKWEIAYRIAVILWLGENLSREKKDFFERDRDWYIAQAVTGSKMPSLDEMESWKNQHVKSIPNINQHENFFKNLQAPEQRYIHPTQYNTW